MRVWNTPQDIFKFMIKNIRYDNSSNWKLKSVEEVYKTKKGNCHDQSHFIYAALKNIGISPRMLFFIEYNNHEESGGRTHSLTYYKERNKIYWIETSWGGFKDIHGPFSNVSELKQLIESKHSEEPEAERYPLIQWGNPNNTKPGMGLNEYVSSCLRIHENNIFYGIEFI